MLVSSYRNFENGIFIFFYISRLSVLEVTKIAQWNKRLDSPVEEGLTIGAVRFSSEDAASLLAFMASNLAFPSSESIYKLN